jgi:hypothetical protein
LGGPPGERPSSPLGTPEGPDESPKTPTGLAPAAEPESKPGATEHPEAGDPEAPEEPTTEEATTEEATTEEPTTEEPTTEEATTEEATTEEAAEEPARRHHGFRVYRRIEAGIYGLPLNREPQEKRRFADTAAPLGATSCYVIRAVGSVDPLIESAPSNEVCLDVRDVAPPSPPTGLAVVPRGGGLEVVWSPSSDPDLAGYRVYRAAAEGEASRVGEVPAGATAWLDTSTEAGTLYRYTVAAFDGAGNEGPPSGTAQGRGP